MPKARKTVYKKEGPNEQAPRGEPIVVRAEEVTVRQMGSRRPRMKYFQLTFLVPLLLVFLVAVAAGGYYLYSERTKEKDVAAVDPALIEKVGSLIELPAGETPTLATVSDVTKLQGQPFFARAQNGDKVLIYQIARKAILYRPGTGKIVEVGPVNTTPQSPTSEVAGSSSAATPTQAAPANVALYNGTNTTGLTRAAERVLSGQGAAVQVTTRGDAKGKVYKETIVVEINGTEAQAEAIAEALNAKVAPLPQGETRPNADILVILGEDFAGE